MVIVQGFAQSLANAGDGPLFETRKLVGSDEFGESLFGSSVSIDGHQALVNAPYWYYDIEPKIFLDSVYAYDVNTGDLISQMIPPLRTEYIGFGFDHSIVGSTAYIGAPFELFGKYNAGGVYAFDIQTNQILGHLPSDDGQQYYGLGWECTANDSVFATSTWQYIDKNGVIDPGGIIVLYDPKTLQELGRIAPEGRIDYGGFGDRIALEGTKLLTGSWDATTPSGQRVTPVFTLFDISDLSNPQQLWEVTEPIVGGVVYGLEIAGDYAVVSSSSFEGMSRREVHVLNSKNGELLYTIGPLEDLSFQFYHEIATHLDGTILCIGNAFAGAGAGEVLVYNIETRELLHTLKASDGVRDDYFGASVAIEGSMVVVGAPGVRGDNTFGAVYIYDLNNPVCLADLTNDGILDFFDISLFITHFANQDPIADFTNDTVWDFFDVSAFISAFSAGCP